MNGLVIFPHDTTGQGFFIREGQGFIRILIGKYLGRMKNGIEDIFWSESAADGSQVRADGTSFITEAVAGATLGRLIGPLPLGEGSPLSDLTQLRFERFPGPWGKGGSFQDGVGCLIGPLSQASLQNITHSWDQLRPGMGKGFFLDAHEKFFIAGSVTVGPIGF